jgi:glyoxylase-like metal-dependent hydrolase (beta-lactamase superfamily II)
MEPPIERYEPAAGIRLYRFPVRAFPGLETMVHLILGPGFAVLVDTGSGFGDSNDDLQAGLGLIASRFGEPSRVEDLTHILVSHGHIDHFGGLSHLRERCTAHVVLHELDLPVVTRYAERLEITAGRLEAFLKRAGASQATRTGLLEMYRITKGLVRGAAVDTVVEGGQGEIGPLRLTHYPGHCPGLMTVRVGDILLTSDLVLPRTSPHQSPEELAPYTGLDHYLASLRRLRREPPPRLALGGHEEPILDLHARIDEIEQLHARRLAEVLEFLKEEHTLSEISFELFGPVQGYHVLLALEEAGAHTEFLLQRGYVGGVNASALGESTCGAARYRRLPTRGWSGLPPSPEL